MGRVLTPDSMGQAGPAQARGAQAVLRGAKPADAGDPAQLPGATPGPAAAFAPRVRVPFAGFGVALAAVAAVLGLWYLATTATGLISPARFPAPAEVWSAARQITLDGYGNARLYEHVLRSVLLVTMGFTVASAFGVALGLAMGASRVVEAIANPVFLLLRPIPPLAWIPLSIVWLGLGNSAKILVIFVAAFVPSVINAYTGVRQIDKPLFEAAAMLGVSGTRYWREVLIPGALPSIFTGLRLSLQAAWTTLVAAELVGAVAGLGAILNQAAQDIYPAMIVVGMASVALCGWGMTRALGWVERRVMRWKGTP